MKKSRFFLLIIILIILLGFWFVLVKPILEEGRPFESSREELSQGEEVEQLATLVIDYGEGELATFEMTLTATTTAFDLLRDKAEEMALTLETKMYDFGVFIEAIGHKKNGQDNKYWLYYLNGELAPVSADKQEVKAGDKVEFRFEASTF